MELSMSRHIRSCQRTNSFSSLCPLVFSLCALWFAFTSNTALAQIDHRVNQGNTNTAGYALDKNPQTGSGGFNLARPGTFDNGSRANAIITCHVTGLGAFHGPAPIGPINQFHANLP